MKMIKFLVAALSFIIAVTSCKKANFLDPRSVNDLTEESVFTDSARTIAVLTGVYSNIYNNFNPHRWSGTGSFMDATDETDPRYTGGNLVPIVMSLGTFTAAYAEVLTERDAFSFTVAYRRIRSANLYLSKVDGSPLSAGC